MVYDVFDSNEVLETKLLAGSTGYDLVVPTGFFLARQIEAGIFQPLDKAKLPNWANLDPELMAKASKYDPGNDHALIYLWGTTGLAYNVDKVKERLPDAPLDSWALLFDPANAEKLADCGIMALDAPVEVMASALRYLGLDPDSKDPAVLDQAGSAAREGPPLHPQVPQLRIHQRAGQRRYLPGARLVRRCRHRRDARRGGQERRRRSPTRSPRKGH